MLVVTASLLLSGCCCCSNIPVSPSAQPGGETGYGTYMVSEKPYIANPADVTAGNKAVADAAAAIESGDVGAFTALMSSDTLSQVHGSPDLTGLVKGLKSARIVEEKKDAFVYEATVNGVDITFMVIKEDGAWKLSGL